MHSLNVKASKFATIRSPSKSKNNYLQAYEQFGILIDQTKLSKHTSKAVIERITDLDNKLSVPTSSSLAALGTK
jgi:hypothetical protein